MLRSETNVGLDADAFLHGVEVLVEIFVVDAERYFTEQLDEAAIRVIGEAFVAGLLDKAFERFGVETQIQDRIHHTGHRQGRSRAYGDEQRIGAAAEGFARDFLEVVDLRPHLGHEALGQRVAVQVFETGLGCDHESGRHVEADLRHFAEIGALAAE